MFHSVSAKAKTVRQRVRTCRRHCLQSCIYLAGFSDIESAAGNFSVAFIQDGTSQLYQKKFLGLLEKYSFLLRRAVFFQRCKGIFNARERTCSKETNIEASRISDIIKEQRARKK